MLGGGHCFRRLEAIATGLRPHQRLQEAYVEAPVTTPVYSAPEVPWAVVLVSHRMRLGSRWEDITNARSFGGCLMMSGCFVCASTCANSRRQEPVMCVA